MSFIDDDLLQGVSDIAVARLTGKSRDYIYKLRHNQRVCSHESYWRMKTLIDRKYGWGPNRRPSVKGK